MGRPGLSPSRVVAEAAAISDEVGLEHLTMAAVAERLGVRVPSLYKHIAGLDGLQRELSLLGLGELAAVIGRAAMGRTGREALHDIAHAYRRFATERPGVYAATMRAPDPSDEELTAQAQEVLDVVLALTRSYGLEGEDAIHAIRILRSAMHGFVAQQAAGAFAMPESIDRTYDCLIDVLDVAFTSWGPKTTT